ncbi:hypothetical protein H5410_002293 [Solanum commersonii]|uniref:Uncharacterized protein n=1 Tax=Solanum commersonii TaxID=4109 RepID=A0A9J6B1L9_SOLCO|nr:hypothetical protein H5410_002293 [Solanum commersonii]
MDVARGILVKMPVKIFIVELFLTLLPCNKSISRDVFHDHFEQTNYQCEVADYLENVGFHKWSRAYFPETSHNAMFNEAREFPIIALFNDISKRWSEKFHEKNGIRQVKTTFAPSNLN